MATYSKEQIEAGIAKARETGNTVMVNRLSSLLNQSSDEPRKYNLEQLEAGIAKAKELGNEVMVSKLSDLYQRVLSADDDPTRPGTSEYLTNQAKLGTTDSAALLAAGVQTAQESKAVKGPTTIPQLIAGVVLGDSKGSLLDSFTENLTKAQETFSKLTGADPNMPLPEDAGVGVQLAGAAVRAITDPVNLVTVGAPTLLKTGAKTLVKEGAASKEFLTDVVLPLAGRTSQIGSFGAIAEGGGMAGASIERNLTGEDTGVGRLTGSILFAPVAAKGVALRQVGSAGLNITTQVLKRVRDLRRDPTAATDAYASGVTKSWLKDVQKNQKNGDFEEILAKYQALEPVLGQKVVKAGETYKGVKYDTDTRVDVKFPLFAAMSDNPVVRSTMVQLLKGGGDQAAMARTRFAQEIDAVSEALGNRLYTMFGPQYATLATTEKGIQAQNKIAKRLIQVNDKLSDTRSRLKPGQTKEQRGKQIRNLVETRKSLAQAEQSAAYEDLMKEATIANARLPANGVKEIHQFVKQNKINDLFIRGTTVERDALGKLRPRQKYRIVEGESVPVVDEKGNPVRAYPSLSFRQMDSLKRAINKQIKKYNRGTSEHNRLEGLKEVLSTARSRIKGDFDERLRDLDILYHEKVGVPFGAQGIKDIDSKKYAQETAPVILKNSESLQDFLDAVGPDGVKIARNAYMSKVYHEDGMFKDGILNTDKLMSMMSKDEEVINLIPGLRQELTATLVNQEVLSVRVKTLDKAAEAVKARATNDFLNLEPGVPPNYQQIARDIQNDPKKLREYFDKMKDLSPEGAETIKNAIKREVMFNAGKDPEGMMSFLNRPANQSFLKRLYGEKMLGYMKKVATMFDSVKRLDIDKITQQVAEEEYDVVAKTIPGLNIPYITSQIRDRIASIFQKLVRLGTRVQEEVAKRQILQTKIDILTDPDSLEKAMKATTQFEIGLENPVNARKFIRSFGEAAPLYFYSTLKAQTTGQEEE